MSKSDGDRGGGIEFPMRAKGPLNAKLESYRIVNEEPASL